MKFPRIEKYGHYSQITATIHYLPQRQRLILLLYEATSL